MSGSLSSGHWQINSVEQNHPPANLPVADRDQWIRRRLLEKRQDDDRFDAKVAELRAYIQQRDIILNVAQRTWKTRSWRWTAIFRNLRKVIHPIPCRETELVECSTSIVRQTDGSWVATGVLPQFILPCLPIAGWIRIELEISTDVESRAHLYFDSGLLFKESESVDLGPVSKDTKREFLIRLERPVHCFRLDPVRRPGRFAIKRFRITPQAEVRVNLTAFRRRWAERGSPEGIIPALTRCLPLLARGRWVQARSSFRAILEPNWHDAASAYDRWCEHRKFTAGDRESQQQWAVALASPPLISILMPVYNTPEKWLRQCIASVIGQTYPHWELCIGNDRSTAAHVRQVLDEITRSDARIRVIDRDENGGISAATNTALDAARGQYVALLDSDDELAPHALHAMAVRLLKNPKLEMIYSDEDKIDENGRHFEPFFKPDWSPDFLLSCMYTGHLSVYRTSLVRKVGGFRSKCDGSQDHDLALRVSERIPADCIGHVPDILYHWRTIASSTALSPEAKPYAWEAARRGIEDHLARRGIAATVEPGPSAGLHHVRYAICNRPLVSIIIPSACRLITDKGKGDFYWARRCIESIRDRSTYENLELIVATPPEMDEPLRAWLEQSHVTLVRYELPFNFSQACNAAAEVARGEHLLFLNDDTQVRSADFIEQMLSLSQLDGVGAVGAKLFYPDGTLQHAGVVILDGHPCHAFDKYPGAHPGYYSCNRLIRNWIAVTGACLMTPRKAFEAVGGFDCDFPMNYNDTDYCLRLRDVGLRIVCTPYAEMTHVSSASIEGHYQHETRRFQDRWTRLITDPFYNPNLSTRSNDFAIGG